MWIDLMKGISLSGFYCVAPNMRGYSKGARPKGKKHYLIDKLSNDVMRIAQYFEKEKFHLVGHNWGAATGWKTAYDNPNVF